MDPLCRSRQTRSVDIAGSRTQVSERSETHVCLNLGIHICREWSVSTKTKVRVVHCCVLLQCCLRRVCRVCVREYKGCFDSQSRRHSTRWFSDFPQELVALAVVLAAAVVVWWWASRKIHQRKERGRRNTTDARSEDEGSDLESGGDDVVNPAGSDIEPAGAADFLPTSGHDVESRRSDVESGSLRSRGDIGAAAGESSLSGEEQEQVGLCAIFCKFDIQCCREHSAWLGGSRPRSSPPPCMLRVAHICKHGQERGTI